MSELVFIFISYNTKCASLIKVLLILAIKDIFKILSILILLQHFIYLQHFFFGNPAVEISDLFQAGNFTVLMGFHGLYKVGGVYQALMSTGIQPGKALP